MSGTLGTRAVAAKTLAAVFTGKSLNRVLPEALENIDPRDRGLLQQLCYGTLRQYHALEGVLDQLLVKPLKEKDGDVKALLLIGLYQLSGTRVPDHAAVSTTVDAMLELKKHWAKGLTNAVLRRYLRERETLEAQLDAAAAAGYPNWLYKKIRKQWPNHADQVFAAGNQQPPMALRVNQQQQTRAAYLDRLIEAGIEATSGAISPQALILKQAMDVADLPGFEQGAVSVQDEAAQAAAILLNAQPGERILDACSAPGGKTCHILEEQNALQSLTAMDIDQQRLAKVEENTTRLQLSAHLLVGDASMPPTTLDHASFDAILVDAPCSATGVIRRHPDVKLLRREADIPQLVAQQLSILQGLWPLLKPGGRLIYATCSILIEENSRVVDKFLALQDDAAASSLTQQWGEPSGCGRQLLPSLDGPDGLFYAQLAKAVRT
ncbi:MAG: 16S rRNA (cytosine967-C5)-methyltransferase [Halioglobus sp.]|jgi:16S rRNA (cytosine967-C5)-methyltransferase